MKLILFGLSFKSDVIQHFFQTAGFTGSVCEKVLNGTSCPHSDCSTEFDGGQCLVSLLDCNAKTGCFYVICY